MSFPQRPVFLSSEMTATFRFRGRLGLVLSSINASLGLSRVLLFYENSNSKNRKFPVIGFRYDGHSEKALNIHTSDFVWRAVDMWADT